MLTKKINKKQVVEYLLKNPDFFCETPKILSELNFPVGIGTKSKNVVSFKDWVISNLKSQKEQIIENARHNYFTQQKIHEAVIDIIKKKGREEFLMYLTQNHFCKQKKIKYYNFGKSLKFFYSYPNIHISIFPHQ